MDDTEEEEFSYAYRLTGHIVSWSEGEGGGGDDMMMQELQRRFDQSGVITELLRRVENNEDAKAEYVVVCGSMDVYEKLQWQLNDCSLHFEVMQRLLPPLCQNSSSRRNSLSAKRSVSSRL